MNYNEKISTGFIYGTNRVDAKNEWQLNNRSSELMSITLDVEDDTDDSGNYIENEG